MTNPFITLLMGRIGETHRAITFVAFGLCILVGAFTLACSSLSVSKLSCDDLDFQNQLRELNAEERQEDPQHPVFPSFFQDIQETRRTSNRLDCRGVVGWPLESYTILYFAEETDKGTYISYEIDTTTPIVQQNTAGTSAAPVSTPSSQRTASPADTIRPKPSPTRRPAPTSTPATQKHGRSRSQPMPISKPLELDNGISISVEDVTKNANQIIKRHDAWTEPPPSGHQFFLVALKVANVGDEPIDIYMVNELSLVGSSNVSYDQGFSNECWTFPNELDSSRTLFPDGSLSGNICFTVKASDVDDLVMYYESISFFGDDEFVYWALR